MNFFNKFTKYVKNNKLVNVNNIQKDFNKITENIGQTQSFKKLKKFSDENNINKTGLTNSISKIYPNYKSNINTDEKKDNNTGTNYYYEKHYHYHGNESEKKEEEKKTYKDKFKFFSFLNLFRKKDPEGIKEILFGSKYFIRMWILVSFGFFSLGFGKELGKGMFKKEKIVYQQIEKNN